MTFAEKVLSFYRSVDFSESLPDGIRIMNPFREKSGASELAEAFYMKYFNDTNPRRILLGINPGRFGAGITGIPFTDTIRLNDNCGIPFNGFRSFEPSSVFIYNMIEACGGVSSFYSRFFISAICPLGFIKQNEKGKFVNYNYYDSRELTDVVYDFIIETLKQQLDFRIDREVGYCLGTGKNDAFLRKINEKHGFFKTIITLEHPRYIMQYKAKKKEEYVEKYSSSLRGA
ncbi:MAG TPA: uracil-DNA glycosylase family protein [Bacteroidales bacterium]|nr:uracil-DNA glycosylase family protein [Bacteroidales bacterium]